MRKPRPQDFDPDYKVPASLQPEAIDIQGSVPIKPHATVKKAVAPDRTENRSEKRTEIRSEFRSENRSATLPIKRRTKRYSFEYPGYCLGRYGGQPVPPRGNVWCWP